MANCYYFSKLKSTTQPRQTRPDLGVFHLRKSRLNIGANRNLDHFGKHEIMDLVSRILREYQSFSRLLFVSACTVNCVDELEQKLYGFQTFFLSNAKWPAVRCINFKKRLLFTSLNIFISIRISNEAHLLDF